MRRLLILPLLLGALAFAGVGFADPGDEGHHGDKHGHHGDDNDHGDHGGHGKESKFGPYNSTSPDNGTCQNPWANDTFKREYKVRDNGDGTFFVHEDYKDGSFVTNAGPSPGACEPDSHHGTTVAAGITGKFKGFIEGTVTGGTYNPNGCNAPSNPCAGSTSGFITATFGPGATFTCFLGFAGCKFDFDYKAHDQGLIYRHWEDKETNGTEQLTGDIASA